ncbi:hypothetical protein ACM26V_00315 [Salipaludibacillus sp. HK11]|uniref:hypothetical protein n=1 Tax=Salipaludibacillus sp. HK11 TaxID=3394320 RepID=UPI0039FD5DBE
MSVVDQAVKHPVPVVLLEDVDLMSNSSELTQIKKLWLEGVSLPEIAKTIKRSSNETFLALFHLSLDNKATNNANIRFTFRQLIGG